MRSKTTATVLSWAFALCFILPTRGAGAQANDDAHVCLRSDQESCVAYDLDEADMAASLAHELSWVTGTGCGADGEVLGLEVLVSCSAEGFHAEVSLRRGSHVVARHGEFAGLPASGLALALAIVAEALHASQRPLSERGAGVEVTGLARPESEPFEDAELVSAGAEFEPQLSAETDEVSGRAKVEKQRAAVIAPSRRSGPQKTRPRRREPTFDQRLLAGFRYEPHRIGFQEFGLTLGYAIRWGRYWGLQASLAFGMAPRLRWAEGVLVTARIGARTRISVGSKLGPRRTWRWQWGFGAGMHRLSFTVNETVGPEIAAQRFLSAELHSGPGLHWYIGSFVVGLRLDAVLTLKGAESQRFGETVVGTSPFTVALALEAGWGGSRRVARPLKRPCSSRATDDQFCGDGRGRRWRFRGRG